MTRLTGRYGNQERRVHKEIGPTTESNIRERSVQMKTEETSHLKVRKSIASFQSNF